MGEQCDVVGISVDFGGGVRRELWRGVVLVVGVGGVVRLGVFPGDPKILRLALFTSASTLLWRARSALVLL